MEWMLLPLRRYADFTGRSRRKEYWMFVLLMGLIYTLVGGLMFASLMPLFAAGPRPETFTAASFSMAFWVEGVLLAVFTLAIIVPSVAVTVRRLHDRDLSGWWYLGVVIAGQIPFVGPLLNLGFLVVMCLPGTPGPNRFGEDPKDPTHAEVFA